MPTVRPGHGRQPTGGTFREPLQRGALLPLRPPAHPGARPLPRDKARKTLPSSACPTAPRGPVSCGRRLPRSLLDSFARHVPRDVESSWPGTSCQRPAGCSGRRGWACELLPSPPPPLPPARPVCPLGADSGHAGPSGAVLPDPWGRPGGADGGVGGGPTEPAALHWESCTHTVGPALRWVISSNFKILRKILVGSLGFLPWSSRTLNPESRLRLLRQGRADRSRAPPRPQICSRPGAGGGGRCSAQQTRGLLLARGWPRGLETPCGPGRAALQTCPACGGSLGRGQGRKEGEGRGRERPPALPASAFRAGRSLLSRLPFVRLTTPASPPAAGPGDGSKHADAGPAPVGQTCWLRTGERNRTPQPNTRRGGCAPGDPRRGEGQGDLSGRGR